MEKNTDYFEGRSEAEKMRNVANMVHDIVNPKPEEPEVQVEGEEKPSEEESSIDPVVDLVGKAIKKHQPKGIFMQTVGTDETPSL